MFKIDKDNVVWVHYGYVVNGKINKAESLKISKNDEKCYCCDNFESNEAGDMLCKISPQVIKYRDLYDCRKNDWFKERNIVNRRDLIFGK